VVWPFDGTYWRDELGGYNYDIRSLCKPKHFPRGWKANKQVAPKPPPPPSSKTVPSKPRPEQIDKQPQTKTGNAAGR
jgi:hypothetical protein